MNSVNPIFPDGTLRPIPLLFRGCVVFLCCSAANLSGQEHSGQGVPAAFVSGFERFARYDEISNTEAGSLLISELNCTACHANDDPWLQPKGGPRLTHAGSRLQEEWLRQYLTQPWTVDSATTMPHVLESIDLKQQPAAVDALVAFLSAQREPLGTVKATGRVPVFREFWNRGDPDRGSTLYHTVGCVACHAPDDSYETVESKPSAIDSLIEQLDPEELEELGLAAAARPVASVPHGNLVTKYTPHSLTMLLYDPTRFRPDARMPSLRLLPTEAADIAAYLLRSQAEPSTKSPKVDDDAALIEQGRNWFTKLRCGNCHQLDSVPKASSAKPLAELNAAAASSCLVNSRGSMPRYKLDHQQITAIKQRLEADSRNTDATEDVRFEMLQLNCFGCHQRDEMGGVGRNRKPYFHTEGHVDLGDEGRLPPPLTGVGRKLTAKSLAAVFSPNTAAYRNYMTIRMPAYPPKTVESIIAKLPVSDHADNASTKQVFGSRNSAELVAAGRQLIDTGCVQCHLFRGESLPGVVGVDLDGVTRRLHPRWFQQFVRQPGVLKKRTRMPTFFPDGKSHRKDLFNGDVDLQIAAIWTYLDQLQEAGLPTQIEKVRAANYELTPLDRPLVLRTFMRQAGMHAIAVGYPQGVHFAFDAETVRPAVAWKERFLDARGTWFERFTPPADPLGKELITLPLGLIVADSSAKSFGGYRLDQQGVPTFLYEIQSSKFQDRIEPAAGLGLKRTINVELPTDARSFTIIGHADEKLNRVGEMSVIDGNGLTVTVISGIEAPGKIVLSDGIQQWLLPIADDQNRSIVLEYKW